MEAVILGLKTGITSISTSSMTAIGDILPVAMPIAGAVIVVTIGLRVFKKIAK